MAVYYASSLVTSTAPTADDINNPGDLQSCFDTATAAGDEVRILADGTYSPTVTIDVDLTGGTQAQPLRVSGANATTGEVDGTVATIDGSGITSADTITVSDGHIIWRNLRVTASTGHGIACADLVNDQLFINIRADNCTTNGILVRGGNGRLKAFNCEFDNNGQYGIGSLDTSGFNRSAATYLSYCSIHDNAYGISTTDDTRELAMDNCVLYNNTNEAVRIQRDYGVFQISNCVFYNNAAGILQAGTYVSTSGSAASVVFNSVFVDHSGYGINYDEANNDLPTVIHCLFNNNTSGHATTNLLAQIQAETSNILDVDPGFVRTTGVPNFTPLPGSPLLNAGFPKRTH